MRHLKTVMMGLFAGTALSPTVSFAQAAEVQNLDYVKAIRAAEAKQIKADKAPVSRKGMVLTLSNGAKPVATFTDKDGLWIYRGQITLKTSTGPRKMTLIDTCDVEHTEECATIFVTPEGRYFSLVTRMMLNPSSQVNADGAYENSDAAVPPHTILTDWSKAPELVFKLKAGCYPIAWKDENTLKVSCPHEISEHNVIETEGVIVRVDDTHWKLTETISPKAKAQLKNVQPVTEILTGVSSPADAQLLKSLGASGYRTF